MLVQVDKFLISELQNRGYKIDYNELIDAYKVSRENPEHKERKIKSLAKRQKENQAISEIEKLLSEQDIDLLGTGKPKGSRKKKSTSS